MVEAVPDSAFAAGVEVEFGMAGDLGVRGTFVNDARVGDIGALEAEVHGDRVADEGAEVAGVLALDALDALLTHELVDTVGAALAGAGEAATAHDDGYFVVLDTMFVDHLHDGLLAIVELVGDLFILLNLFDGVLDVFGEDFGLTLIDRSFCRGSTGVDG